VLSVRYRVSSGKHLLGARISGLDQERTIIRLLKCSSNDASRCRGNTASGGSKLTSGFVDIEGNLLAPGRADRVERKMLRNQRVYA
jgi:hypothetical protein